MSKERILIVEDDKNISKLIKYNLEKEGYKCRASFDGENALKILEGEKVDLIILDIMLPGMDGLEVCRKIKGNKPISSIPIVVLTAKGEEVDKIVGFELGVDDYMVKPFSPRELILRIKAIFKRLKPMEDEALLLSVSNLKVDLPRHKVTVSKNDVGFSHIEFFFFFTLFKKKGRVQ